MSVGIQEFDKQHKILVDSPNQLHRATIHHHELRLDEVKPLSEKMLQGKHFVSFERMHFLKPWLTKHIMEEDKKYPPLFLSEGVQSKYRKSCRISKLWHS